MVQRVTVRFDHLVQQNSLTKIFQTDALDLAITLFYWIIYWIILLLKMTNKLPFLLFIVIFSVKMVYSDKVVGPQDRTSP